MLIRMCVDKTILSVLFLAGVSICLAGVAEDGYNYSKPSVGFSDGLSNFGSQTIYTKPKEYVVASSSPKPTTTTVFQGFGGSVQEYKAPIVTKPQTSFGGSQVFGLPSSSYSRPASPSPQYQPTQKYQSPIVSTTVKPVEKYIQPGLALSISPPKTPQTSFGSFLGFSQSNYKFPPQQSFGQYQPTVSIVAKPKPTSTAGFQGFTQTNSYSKPELSQSGYGQTNVYAATKPSSTYKPQISLINVTTKPTSKPVVTKYNAQTANSFQGFGQTKPVSPVYSQFGQQAINPQTANAFEGFGQTKPVSAVYSQFGQQAIKPAITTVQYQKPLTVIPKPQTSFSAFQGPSTSTVLQPIKFKQQPLKPTAFTTSPAGQYQAVQFQKPTVENKQVSSTFNQYQKPLVTSKPFPNSGSFQGLSQTTFTKPQVSQTGFASSFGKPTAPFGNVGPSYLPPNKPAVTPYNFQGIPAVQKVITTPKPVVFTAKPQANLSGFQGFGQAFPQKATFIQYGQPSVKPTFKPSQNSFSTVQGFGQSSFSKPAVNQYSKPIVVTPVKPVFNQPIPQKPLVSVSNKAQSAFGSFQGFGQTTYQKPSVSQAVFTSKATSKPQLSYQAPKVQVSVLQPVSQKFTSTPITVKPQTSFSGFSQSVYQKPAVSTFNNYGQQAVTRTLTTSKPLVVTVKPQTGFGDFGQSVYQKPSSNTFSTYGQQPIKPAIKPTLYTTAKPKVTYAPIISKPQASFSGFGQSINQKPAVNTFSTYKQTPRYTSTPTTAKPVIVTPRPLTAFGGFEQSVYQKPAVTTTAFNGFGQPDYQKPAANTFNTFGQQAITKFTSTPTTSKPEAAFSGFGQQVYQKPVVSTFSTFGQQSVKPAVVTGQFQQPIAISTSKPQTSFGGFGPSVYQKPAVNTFNTFGQQAITKYTSTPTTSKPQAAFSGFGQQVYQKPVVSTSSTYGQQSVKPAVVTGQFQQPIAISTSKPQTSFGGFGQSVYQKPAVNTFSTFGKPVVTKYTNTPTTSKPQAAFSGFGQQVYQKPVVSTFRTYGQQSVKPAVVTGQFQQPIAISTSKPQTIFSSFGQSVYQKPSVNTFGQESVTKLTSTPTTVKPLTVTLKPQAVFTGFEQAAYQKPAVSNFGQKSIKPTLVTYTTTKPQVSITSFTSKPQTSFPAFSQSFPQKSSAFSTFSQETVKPAVVQYQKQIVVTPSPQVSYISTTSAPKITLSPQSLTYLPPNGAQAPFNADSSSGAVQVPSYLTSNSFFEYPSTTANQVVDVAHAHKVEGFVADQTSNSRKSELPTITNQKSSVSVQEQQVEGIDLRSSKPTATNQGEDSELYNVLADNSDFEYEVVGFKNEHSLSHELTHKTKRDTLSQVINPSADYQANYGAQTGYLSYQGNPITTQQFGGVQPNTYQGVPYQQIAQAQSAVGLTASLPFLDHRSYQGVQRQIPNSRNPFQDPYKFEGQYGYISSVEDQQQQIPQNYQAAASYTDAVNSQVSHGLPVQDPQPLNTEEQQVRQVVEKADSDFKNLQPGSYVGPHVNKNSDHEYNVFDYDQYSREPEDPEAEV